METTVKERLIEFIRYKKISIREFERLAGLSNGYMKSLRKSPTVEKMSSIVRAFPELNRIWLQTGEGEMLSPQDGYVSTVKGDGNVGIAGNSNHVEVPAIISKALDEISAQRMLTQKAQDQLDKAYEQVSKAQEQIDRLITLLEKQHQ